MHNLALWLRWSWRDLRDRWLQVSATALIVAMGVGVYSGLSSTTPWRLDAADRSYALLNMFDLHIELAPGSYSPQNAFIKALATIPHAHNITHVQERLIVRTTVQARSAEDDILVRGLLIGAPLDVPLRINDVYPNEGRALTPQDSGQPVALLEYHFAQYYDLPPSGTIELSGGVPLDYVGQGLTPEYFMVMTQEGGIWAEANLAAVFTSLSTAQDLTGHADQVNDAVLLLAEGADLDLIQSEIETALREAMPHTGFTLIPREDDPVRTMTYNSTRLNQTVYDTIAWLFIMGAVLGAFNLASRLVESQRRQIGIGMALGLDPHWLALRPLLVGTQIAIIGTLLGIGLGLATGYATSRWINNLIPMPASGAVFQPNLFAQGALIGLIFPVVATLYPVWRAVRVEPVDAIRTGHLAAKTGTSLPRIFRGHMPGNSFIHVPIRNLLRAPRRTLFTLTGIATAITTLIGMVGMLDTARTNMDRLERETLQNHPTQQIIMLNNAYVQDSEPIAAITTLPEIELAMSSIRVPGKASRNTDPFDVMIEIMPLDNPIWTPTLIQGERPSSTQSGVLISKSAAADLGVKVGDAFTLTHPYRTGPFTYDIRDSELVVAGFHADPWRFNLYLDASQADLLGMDGLANVVRIVPNSATPPLALRQALFAQPSVAAVMPVTDSLDSLQAMMREVIRFLSGVKLAVIVLAFLIAFNSTMITIGERTREIATMFAFGVRIRTVTGMAMIENLLTGLSGTLLGIVFGRAIVIWFYARQMPAVIPTMRFDITLHTSTAILALVIGVGVVALTPLFTMRHMAKMDIPAALRVME